MEVFQPSISERCACCSLTIQYNICSTVGRSIASMSDLGEHIFLGRISAMELPTVLYILHTTTTHYHHYTLPLPRTHTSTATTTTTKKPPPCNGSSLSVSSVSAPVGGRKNTTLRAEHGRNYRIVCPYASCNDCCIMHSTSAGADPELVGGGGGWSCMLLLHPVPTCADAGPDLCTLHPDLCTMCLRWQSLVFFLPPTGADTRLTLNLHCVVMVF